jgi:hypothetical protein
MLKSKMTVLYGLQVIVFIFLPEVSQAQSHYFSYGSDKRSRLIQTVRPVMYVKDARIKTRKYVYNMDTRDVTQAQVGKLLPSQVGLESKAEIQNQKDRIALKNKTKIQNKRSIASKAP